jgi:N-acetylneuraminate synthase/sialic acid synthase
MKFNLEKFREASYLIAEVGQNHNGDLKTALEFIKVFANNGADAVKFQMRNNKILFSQEAYDRSYDSENSFAKTYGEHREALELKIEDFKILKDECKKWDVDFMVTPFDEPSLNFLVDLKVDVIKISSFDLGNLPFINKIAKTGIPIVMSIGGGQEDQIKGSIDLILKYHNDVAIMHCVSEYPCEFNRLGLENIQILINIWPNLLIGSSDHFNGILSGPIAYLLGARIFEKHVTLNRSWKGTDQSFSLEPTGFSKFRRDIDRVGKMLPMKSKVELGSEKVFSRLGKSVIAYADIKAGEKLTLENLSGRILTEIVIPVRRTNEIIGKTALVDIKTGEIINYEKIK